MKTVLDQPKTQNETQTQSDFLQADEELQRRVEKGIDDAKAALSEKLKDGKAAAERLFKNGRYAVEDGLGELMHTIKRHPISFLGIAFAAGAAFGLLMAQTAKTSDVTAK